MDEPAHPRAFFGTLRGMRPVLRPGVHVLRRADRQLQLGLDPRHAVVLPDDEDVRGTLTKLRTATHRSGFTGQTEQAVLALLADNDLLVDSDVLVPAASTRSAMPRPDLAALVRAVGDRARAGATQRSVARIRVLPFGPPCSTPLAEELAGLLGRVGIPAAASSRRPAEDEVVALVGVGEPQRDLVDPWVRDGHAHLLLRVGEGAVTVGPFVRPGQTACLRCIDAHHTDADPSWPLLVTQYADLAGHDRPDGAAEPVDRLSTAIGTAWAARDIASYVEGRAPSSWSTTIRLEPALTSLESRAWLRHPACGCGWG